MTKTRPLKNPHWDPLDLFDEPGVPPVYLGPDQGIHPVSPVPLYHLDEPMPNEWQCYPSWLAPTFPALYCIDKPEPWFLHLDPGPAELRENDWLRCAPVEPPAA